MPTRSTHSEISHDRMCGEGEWQSGQGEVYVGSFVDDVFEGILISSDSVSADVADGSPERANVVHTQDTEATQMQTATCSRGTSRAVLSMGPARTCTATGGGRSGITQRVKTWAPGHVGALTAPRRAPSALC